MIMAFTDIVYRTLVSKPVGEYPQRADQACQAIGANLVTGFTTYRYEFIGLDKKPCTVVAVYGSNGVLFGAYEFTGRM